VHIIIDIVYEYIFLTKIKKKKKGGVRCF